MDEIIREIRLEQIECYKYVKTIIINCVNRIEEGITKIRELARTVFDVTVR